ncbi:MAG: 23S rRNA (pseudouridine(1915)-N(3))-methyltransferase RlmH [Pseudomonadota bacterium]
MRVTIIAVGRMKTGPERTLFDDYAARFRNVGRGIGFRAFVEIEIDAGGGLEREGERLLAKCPSPAKLIRLDEHGAQSPSVKFAADLTKLKDDGVADLVFLIGGAEGYSEQVKSTVPDSLALGPQTWPHKIVRVLLAEQLYRAATILSGSPYHKA